MPPHNKDETPRGTYYWYRENVLSCGTQRAPGNDNKKLGQQRSAAQSRVLVSGHFLIGEKKAPRKGPVVIARSGYDQRLIGGYLT